MVSKQFQGIIIMHIGLNQLISKPLKTIIITMVTVISLAGTMEAGAAASGSGCIHSNGNANGCDQAHSIPGPTTLALFSIGLLGVFGVKRLK